MEAARLEAGTEAEPTEAVRLIPCSRAELQAVRFEYGEADPSFKVGEEGAESLVALEAERLRLEASLRRSLRVLIAAERI